jgi:hypothetical protein
MIVLAHIGGLPVEELLTPLAGAIAAGMLIPFSSIALRLRRFK